jgi:hypothetical protein
MKNSKLFFSIIVTLLINACGSTKPQPTTLTTKSNKSKNKISASKPIDKKSNVKSKTLKNWKEIDLDKLETNYFSGSDKTKEKILNDSNGPQEKFSNSEIIISKTKNILETANGLNSDESNMKKGYSNSIRVKTVYEIANETKPSLFLPHDEFETAKEYKLRVTEQVKLMKEIVLMTSQKMEIRNAQRIKIAKDKELKKIELIQSLMTESASSLEFTPNDIGRYNPEKETFPVVLHNVQYQINVPREEARSFKENFNSIKIKGIKQLKPKYDIFISAKKAHIRSRPNGSIIGIANNGDVFEHVQDEDEWHKINYKGQFGFTHQNNAELKLVDIANEYEYLDLVAIHPTTGSLFAMISVDELVKAPLNLASRKFAESGKTDGPK